MAIKTFKTYLDSSEANIDLTKLHANDIPCFLTNEQMNDILGHMKVGLGGIHLMLHDYDFEKATKLLSPESTDITCPNCSSDKIHQRSDVNSKMGIIGFVKLLFSLIILAPNEKPNKHYQCIDCDHDFSLAVQVAIQSSDLSETRQ